MKRDRIREFIEDDGGRLDYNEDTKIERYINDET